jgi:hypothetical protein
VVESGELYSRPMQCVDGSTLGILQCGINTAPGNVIGDEWRWHEKDRNSTFTVTELLNKHTGVSCYFRSLSFLCFDRIIKSLLNKYRCSA